MRKPTFCICENNRADQLCGSPAADQLCGSPAADQRLCFRCIYSIIIPPVYEVYRGYIVFAFSVCVCVLTFFSSKISQQLLDLGF